MTYASGVYSVSDNLFIEITAPYTIGIMKAGVKEPVFELTVAATEKLLPSLQRSCRNARGQA